MDNKHFLAQNQCENMKIYHFFSSESFLVRKYNLTQCCGYHCCNNLASEQVQETTTVAEDVIAAVDNDSETVNTYLSHGVRNNKEV